MATRKLGEILLEEKFVTKRQLDQALELQVTHGGRLGTNLLELGHIKESELGRALAKQHGVAFAVGRMVADEKLLALFERTWLIHREIMPMRLVQDKLTLAMVNPQDAATLNVVKQRSRTNVVPVVVPEIRLQELLRKYCKDTRPVRVLIDEFGRGHSALLRKEGGAPRTVTSELISEDEFDKLYGAMQPPARPSAPDPSTQKTLEMPALSLPDLPPAPSPSPSAPQPPPAPSGPMLESRVEFKTVDIPASALPPSLVPIVVETAKEPEPEFQIQVYEPLEFEVARKKISEAETRDDIITGLIGGARHFYKRCALFLLQRQHLTGLATSGEEIIMPQFREFHADIEESSPFGMVARSGSHFFGRASATNDLDALYEFWQMAPAATAALVPVDLRGKIVNILYVDDGAGQETNPEIAQLLLLCRAAGEAYERMIVKQKSTSK